LSICSPDPLLNLVEFIKVWHKSHGTLAAAAKIDGMTPAALLLVLAHVKKAARVA
jgi:hypothetical protein